MDFLTEMKEIEKIINEGKKVPYKFAGWYSGRDINNKEIKSKLDKFTKEVWSKRFAAEVNRSIDTAVENIRKAISFARNKKNKKLITAIRKGAKGFDENIKDFVCPFYDLDILCNYLIGLSFKVDKDQAQVSEGSENCGYEHDQEFPIANHGSVLKNIPKRTGFIFRWKFNFNKFSSEFNRDINVFINRCNSVIGSFIDFLDDAGAEKEDIRYGIKELKSCLRRLKKYTKNASKNIEEIGRNIDSEIK